MANDVDEEGELFTIDTSKLIEEARKIRKAREASNQLQREKLAAGRSAVATDAMDDEPTFPRGFEAPITDQQLAAGVSPLVRREVQEEIKAVAQGRRPLLAGIAPIAIPTAQAPSNRPKSFFESEGQTRLAAISGGKTVREFNEFQKRTQQAETEFKNRIRELEQKQINLEKKIFENARNILTGTPLAGALAFLKKGGPEAAIIATIVAIVVDEVGKEFDRGGTLSTKIKVPQQALTINDLEQQNDYRSGNKYITSDMRITQRSPQNSNTANIKDEHIRYTLDNLGR